MPTAAKPALQKGRVYRTRELGMWGRNPTRLAKRLALSGQLLPLRHGLYAAPRRNRFGVVPPTDEELMRAFLDGASFVFTGPEYWNALGLGSTAVMPGRLVYNTKRSDDFVLGGRRFLLRRVDFPMEPNREWYLVDLLEHHELAGVSLTELRRGLMRSLGTKQFGVRELREMAEQYGSKRTQKLIEESILGGTGREGEVSDLHT